MARKKELAVVGGAKRRLQKRTPRNWSKAKASAFLSVLVETCNVSEACRQTGLSITTVYRQRKANAAFRASWIEAVAIAYQRLELVLLDRAFNGTEKLLTRRDGSEERMREYSNQLGLSLLKMHRDTAVEAELELPPSEIEEIRERLINKVERLKARRDSERAAVDAA